MGLTQLCITRLGRNHPTNYEIDVYPLHLARTGLERTLAHYVYSSSRLSLAMVCRGNTATAGCA